MISISKTSTLGDSILGWLAEEYDAGRVSFHEDGVDVIFTFYYPEDEDIFRLKFGKDFPPEKERG